MMATRIFTPFPVFRLKSINPLDIPDRALGVFSASGWSNREYYGDANILFEHDKYFGLSSLLGLFLTERKAGGLNVGHTYEFFC